MTEPAPLTLADVTIDRSLIYPTTTRRFLMALWEMDGLRINLVPRTVKEVWGLVQESEIDYWVRRLGKEAERTGTVVSRENAAAIERAAADAAAAWIDTELGCAGLAGRNDSMLHAVTLTDSQSGYANEIAVAIPPICFRGERKDDHRGDRQIIAQSVVGGFRILASDNRSSIRRTQMNGWLIDEGLATRRLVLNADDAIEEAGSWRTRPARMLEAALRATLPGHGASVRREKTIIADFIERMGNEGLAAIARTCTEQWTGPHAAEVYDDARAHIARGPTLARDTEARRVHTTRIAARNAGYRAPER